MRRLTRISLQWLTILISCFGILSAAHGVQLAQGNIWDPIKPETETSDSNTESDGTIDEAEGASEDPAEDTSEPVASEPVASEPVASEPVASEPVASEPVASEPVASEPVASEPVASEPVASEPAQQASKKSGSAQCPESDVVNKNLYKGQWQNDQNISFWVDFVTRPMYQNDKVTDLSRVLLMSDQINCRYRINEKDEINLIIKATHRKGLTSDGSNWQKCNDIECEQKCLPKNGRCQFKINE